MRSDAPNEEPDLAPGEGAEPEDLAADYLARKAEGERVDLEAYVARLAAPGERALLREIVAGAERAARELPRPVTAGRLLCGRYRIEREIGGGGQGRVFAARDEQLDRPVAVKVLSSVAAGDRDAEQLFQNEWRLLAALRHPNIVPVFDSGREDDIAYFVMDHIDGTSLSSVIERARAELAARPGNGRNRPRDGQLLRRAIDRPVAEGRVDLVEADWFRTVARIVLELARTIEAAHGQGVVHRDLKPGNVMLVGGGQPVVLDFGFAGSARTGSGGVTTRLYGSVPYLAPEQVRQERAGKDPRTDVYQLGTILYELLTLRRAFPGDAVGDVIARIQKGEFPSPRKVHPGLPVELEAICLRALEIDPERRYRSARALREDLERHLSGHELPHAMRGHVWRATARRTRYLLRRHPLAASIAGMLVVGLAVAGAVVAQEKPFLVGLRFSGPPDAPRAELASEDRPLQPGDLLGVRVQSDVPTCLYVLSSFENAEGEMRFSPMRPQLRGLATAAEGEPFGFVVPACNEETPHYDVVCAEVVEENQSEGLVVLALSGPRGDFERWFDDLDGAAGAGGLSLERVADLYANPPRTRGGPPDVLPPEERVDMVRRLQLALDREKDFPRDPVMARCLIQCPVEKKTP